MNVKIDLINERPQLSQNFLKQKFLSPEQRLFLLDDVEALRVRVHVVGLVHRPVVNFLLFVVVIGLLRFKLKSN